MSICQTPLYQIFKFLCICRTDTPTYRDASHLKSLNVVRTIFPSDDILTLHCPAIGRRIRECEL